MSRCVRSLWSTSSLYAPIFSADDEPCFPPVVFLFYDILQHPLYSPWTLWFDSPATKGRNLPQTPMTAFPQTPVPQTPGAGANTHGWMDDIKRVISFDSVEEFWG
jgi:hypothetical protein